MKFLTIKMTSEIPSFKDRKDAYFDLLEISSRGLGPRGTTRAAHLSQNVFVVSSFGDGNGLSFIYDPLAVGVTTSYNGEIVEGVGVIDFGAFIPRIIEFDDAMLYAKRKFRPLAGKSNEWYPKPRITRETRNIERHILKEADRSPHIVVLNPEDILPEFRINH